MRNPDENALGALRRFAIAFATLTVFTGGLSGCGTRNDRHFNAYRAPSTAPRIMRRADGLMDAANGWLDNLDVRMENAIR